MDQKLRSIRGKAAYQSILPYFSELVRCGRAEEFVPDLFSQNILRKSTVEKMRSTSEDSQAKMEMLLLEVMQTVRTQPHHFDFVCDVLEKANPSCIKDIRGTSLQGACIETMNVLRDSFISFR